MAEPLSTPDPSDRHLSATLALPLGSITHGKHMCITQAGQHARLQAEEHLHALFSRILEDWLSPQ